MKKQLSVIEEWVVVDVARDQDNIDRIIKSLEDIGCNSAVNDILSRFAINDSHVIIDIWEDSLEVSTTMTDLAEWMEDDEYDQDWTNSESNERVLH